MVLSPVPFFFLFLQHVMQCLMQVLTSPSATNMLQLLSAVVTHLIHNSAAMLGKASALVSGLWTALLTLLQQGAPAAKLSAVSHCDDVHCYSCLELLLGMFWKCIALQPNKM